MLMEIAVGEQSIEFAARLSEQVMSYAFNFDDIIK